MSLSVRFSPLLRPVLALAFSAAVAACAPQIAQRPIPSETPQPPPSAPVNPGDVLRAEVQREDRIYRVSAQLLTSGVDYCPSNISLDPGFTVWNDLFYGESNRTLLQGQYNLSAATQIRALAPWVSREGYDLRVGDTIGAVGGVPVPTDDTATTVYNNALINDLADEVVELTIVRGGAALQGQVQAKLICFFLFEPLSSPRIDSTVTQDTIAISDGLYGLATTDPLLAAILAQEIARALQAGPDLPPPAPQFAQLDQQFGISTGQSYRDAVAMDLLGRAGIDPGQVAQLWTLMGQQDPATLADQWNQPISPARLTWLTQTAQRAAQGANRGSATF